MINLAVPVLIPSRNSNPDGKKVIGRFLDGEYVGQVKNSMAFIQLA
jgi:hypothetical protein